jgi:hypothetical protein
MYDLISIKMESLQSFVVKVGADEETIDRFCEIESAYSHSRSLFEAAVRVCHGVDIKSVGNSYVNVMRLCDGSFTADIRQDATIPGGNDDYGQISAKNRCDYEVNTYRDIEENFGRVKAAFNILKTRRRN